MRVKISKNWLGRACAQSFFKAVYLPSVSEASVYYSANSENGTTEIITLNEFAERTGIDVMPSLGADIKNKRFELPLNAVDNNGDPAPAPKSEKVPQKKTQIISRSVYVGKFDRGNHQAILPHKTAHITAIHGERLKAVPVI